MFGSHYRISDPVSQGIKNFDKGKNKAFSGVFIKRLRYVMRRRSRVSKYTCSFKSRKVEEIGCAR